MEPAPAPLPDPDSPPEPASSASAAAALRRTERGLAAVLAISWLIAAAHPQAGAAAVRVVLVGCAALAGAGRLPRLHTALGAVAFAAALPGSGGPARAAALVLGLGAAGVRLALRSGESGAWLASVERAARARRRLLVATELARADAGRAADPAARALRLARAGDHYEAAGRLRAQLVQMGAPDAAGERGARAVGAALARILAPFPALAERLERRLSAHHEGPG